MSVEIIGRACLAPGANSPQELFRILRERRSTVSEVPHDRWDKARYWHPETGVPGKTYTFAAGVLDGILDFDPALFGMSPREAESLDPQQRLMLRMAWRALEDASLTASRLRKERVGVYVGASSLEYGNLIVGDPAAASPYFMTGNTLSVIANRISHVFEVRGPSLTVDTACSSGLVALDLAVRALEDGDIETAIVGSVNVLAHPLSFVGFAQARMLSPYGQCRAYDNRAEGYVRAEGGAVLVLRRTDRASTEGDRSHARIVASGVNSAGRTNGISLPSAEAQAALLRSIYSENAIDVSRLSFIEGHGTGTRVGDPAEIWSIGTEIGQNRNGPIPIGSIKSNIGHTEPASGLLGLMKAMLALEHNYLPASLHFDTPNEQIDFTGLNVSVAADPIELLPSKRPRFAGVNSFGFGGTNAHVVICDPDRSAGKGERQTAKLLFASAQSAESLTELLSSYRSLIAQTKKPKVAEAIAAIGSNRPHLKHRFALPLQDQKAMLDEIDAFLDGKDSSAAETAEAFKDQAKTAFVFSGNGSQWAGMASDAYRHDTMFRERFKVIDALFGSISDIALIELLFATDLETQLADTRIAQPLLFATQAALADSLIDLGLTPSVTYGHSIGEVAAAYVSGAISLVDAVTIVSKRSRHQHKVAGQGKMAAVAMGADEAAILARSAGLENLHVAASNAHNAATLSGPVDEIAAFRELAVSKRIAAQVLDIDYPFHHPLIDSARRHFLKDMSSLTRRPTAIPFISTVTGKIMEGEGLDPAYWWHNIREPVRFATATETALGQGCTLFIEIGPRPILSSYLRDTLRLKDVRGTVMPSLLRGGRAAGDPVRKTFAKAVAAGAAFDSAKALGSRNAYIDLPPLPFEPGGFRYTRTPEALDLYGDGNRDTHSLVGWRVDGAGNAWRNHVDAHLYPDLAEHVVDGRSILPGSAFLEMMLAAARRYHGDKPFEITNLEILHAMDLSTSRLLEVSTVVSPETGQIEIRSRERLNEENWTVHAIARSRASVAPLTWIEQKRLEDPEVIDAEDVYRTAGRFGLDYGPSFQLLEQIARQGQRHLEVVLRDAARPAHPFLTYELDPVATDAAFHGLVGLFGRFATSFDNAPYIPVHIGTIQLYRSGASIRCAKIAIERISPYSIKANIRLLDGAGEPIATLMDCRFRRSRLRPHKPLESQSYHYELAVTNLYPFGWLSPSQQPSLKPLLPDLNPSNARADASLLLDAAVYRACYDVCFRQRDGRGKLPAPTGAHDLAFECLLSSCLYHLEEAGLAKCDAGDWTLTDECQLPSFDDIVIQFLKEDASRSAEAILLNDAYHMALTRAGNSGFPAEDKANPRKGMSETTLDQVLSRGPSTEMRQTLLVEALSRALEAALRDSRRHIVEMCAVSKSLSMRLAKIADDAQARLTVVEANDRLRNDLQLAFMDMVHVDVVAHLDSALSADLVVSASNDFYEFVEMDGTGRAFVRSVLMEGGSVLAFVEAPGLFTDFVLGQREGWYSRTVDAAFPIGKLAREQEWEHLAERLGVSEGSVKSVRGPVSNAICIAWSGQRSAGRIAEERKPAANLLVACAGKPDVEDGAFPFVVSMTGDEAVDRAATASALGQSQAMGVVYVSGPLGDAEGSEALQANIAALSAIVKELAFSAESRLEKAQKPKLAVLLPLGSPFIGEQAAAANSLAAARSAGLWSFLRAVRNEYPDIEIHALDLAAGDWDLAAELALAAELLGSAYANREWVVDPTTKALCEVRVVQGPIPTAQRTTRDFDAATVRQDVISQITSLDWRVGAVRDPGPGEVRIEVAATALNYRDVMWAMGLLPEEALEDGFAGASIGMECAGIVMDVGSGVEGLRIGDRVMAIAPEAFSTHVVAAAQGVAKLPDSVPTVAGATLPVAFLTAYYALVELGRLAPGETVLIHGGAGGVGLAGLQIARARGAKVIATASTTEKRRLLTMLGADHVLDSRSLDFAKDTLDVTDQAGVDVVLNSLFGDAMERSISLLKPFGRFLELGKRDYFADSKIGLRPFRRNVSYFGIDADQLLKCRSDLTARLFDEIATLFAEQRLSPLAFRAFPYNEIKEAFRLMQGSGHIGKIVVTPPMSGRDAVLKAPPIAALAGDGVYLVVGGTGGFGLAAAEWLVERGARSIALCSRRGALDRTVATTIDRWTRLGVATTVHACDVRDEAAVAILLNELRMKAPLRGIIHAAMVLDDALLINLDKERNKPVIGAKAKGAEILDRLTRSDALDHFIMFSSVTTLVGNLGQANYVAGNGFLEGLARARRQSGLPALAVGFGAISDVGYLADSEPTKALLTKRLGKSLMTAREALDKLGEYMAIDPGTVGAATIVISELNLRAARSLETVNSPLFAVLARALQHQPSGLTREELDLPALIEGKSAQEGEQIVFDLLAKEIAATLRVPTSEIGRTRIIREIGIDSLMAMELGMNFQQKTGFDLPLTNVSDNTTVGEVAHRLYLRIAGSVEAVESSSADQIIIDRLVGLHSDDQNARVVNQ